MRQNERLRIRMQRDVDAFLKNGGKIQKIPPGLSSDIDSGQKFKFSSYEQKMHAVEKAQKMQFWEVVSKFASSGYSPREVASSIDIEPGEFIYMIQRFDKGHLWPSGTNY